MIPNIVWLELASVVRNVLISASVIAAFTLSHPAQAQPAEKVPRIGYLTPFSISDPQNVFRVNAFRQGLRDIGYIEGKNINIEYRYAEGKVNRLEELAAELVRLRVDVLVAANDTAARAARKASATIPIVMAGSGNPIGGGLIASQARPGGNVTGLTSYTAELLGKRLALLKEVLPKVSRFAFLNDSGGEASAAAFKDAQRDAKFLAITLRLVEVRAPNPDIDGAFRFIVKERIGGLVTSPAPLITFNRKKILQLAEQNRIPAIHPEQQWATAGGLMSYGASAEDQYRRAAVFVDKILKGTKPADLPVEGPMKFELVINLKTAKALNLTIPQSVLFRADKVIR